MIQLDLQKAACIQKAMPRDPAKILETYKEYANKQGLNLEKKEKITEEALNDVSLAL